MNISDFSQIQREALIDLLVLGMYADGHLAVAEDVRLQQWLVALGYEISYDRDRQLDASVTRVRQHAENTEAARAYIGQLAQCFGTEGQRRRVCELLEQLMASDAKVAPAESRFLAMIREALHA